jgi:hypothetical protein
MENVSSPENKGPIIPPNGELIPDAKVEKGPNTTEIMKEHINHLSKRNKSVDGQLFVDIGEGSSRTLISETPLTEGRDSYRMVVVEDGIMAIKSSEVGKRSDGKNYFNNDMKNMVDSPGRNQFAKGYEKRLGSHTPQIHLDGSSIGQSGNYYFGVDQTYKDVSLLINPSQELVSKMIQTSRDRFQQLSAEKATASAQKVAAAEGLKTI